MADKSTKLTNGEMIQKVFNCEVCEPIPEDDIIHVIFFDKNDSAIGFDWSWWNAEYKEPTTKNDIGVDCISRADALDSIATMCSSEELDIDFSKLLLLQRAIKALPSVTPTRPKGHWIETAEEYYKAINEKGGGVNEDTDYFTDDIACSECLAKFSVIENEAERFDFCPCCGADMRESEE